MASCVAVNELVIKKHIITLYIASLGNTQTHTHRAGLRLHLPTPPPDALRACLNQNGWLLSFCRCSVWFVCRCLSLSLCMQNLLWTSGPFLFLFCQMLSWQRVQSDTLWHLQLRFMETPLGKLAVSDYLRTMPLTEANNDMNVTLVWFAWKITDGLRDLWSWKIEQIDLEKKWGRVNEVFFMSSRVFKNSQQ